jgi:DNA-binding response OmpR family regulator
MIRLPSLNPVEGENNRRNLSPTVRGPRLCGLKVALVEDEVTEGDLLRNALIQEGARVCAFNSAADFSRWLKGGEGPDVLITDWILADGAGDELVRQVRASYADVPVILMSGRLQENELAEGVLSGRARFLGKPFMMEELIVLLGEWRST